MAKIVIDARESGTSTGRYIDKLIEHMHGLKPAHEIVILTKTKRIEYLQKIAPKFTVLTTRFKEFTLGEQLGFWLQLRRQKADLVHFGMTQQPILYRGRVVTTIHDLTTMRFNNPSKNWLAFKFKQFVYKWVTIIVAHKSKTIIAISQYVKQDVAKFAGVNSRKIAVIYEAAEPIEDKPEPVDALIGKKFIMYVGRPNPHKNLKRLVESFNVIKQSHPDLVLALAGKRDSLYEQFTNKLKRVGSEDIVQTGFISDGQLRWMYEHAAVYVFPSLSEGFGLPGLEAMVHGAPVAASNATSLPEIYKDGAHYFDPLDVDDMAIKITEILTDESLRKSLIIRGQKVASKYSWDRTAEETLAVYDEVLQ